MRKHQVFLVWFAIFLVWAIYRAKFYLPETIDEFLVKPLIFVLPVLYVVKMREKEKITSLGLVTTRKNFLEDLYIGVAIGVVFALEGLFANYLKYGKLSFAPILALRLSGGLYMFLLTNFFTSISEEILGRGYLFQRLVKATNNQFGAALTSSFLFLLLHVPIMFTRLKLTGTSLLIYPVSIMILGVTNCYILRSRGSLTLPILIHTFWNMTVALYL